MIKWLIRSVLPGLDDVFANPLWLQSILIRLDFPTLDRPIKAYSLFVSAGHLEIVGAEITNSDFFISIVKCSFYRLKAQPHLFMRLWCAKLRK